MGTTVAATSAPTQPAELSVPIGSFLPHVDELMFLLAADGTVAEVSPSACAMLRAEPKALRGGPFAPWVREQDNLAEVLAEAAAGPAPAYAHLTLLPNQIDAVPAVACAQRLPVESSNLLLILKPLEAWDREPQLAAEIQRLEEKLVELQISLGETARKLSEKTVQLAEERNKTLAVIANMPAGVVALDAEGKVTQANDRAEELLGLAKGRLLSRPFAEAAPEVAEALTAAEAGREFPFASIRLALGTKTLQIESSSIQLNGGKDPGRVIVIHDRTPEEELNRMREELVSVVSHEMRGPLTTVAGYLKVILRGEAGPLEAETRQLLNIVNDSARRLSALVDDLLDLASLESGRVRLNQRAVNVAALIYCVYCDLERRSEEKGIALDTEVPDQPLRVFGDEDRLLQVLTNLASNAVKFTPMGGQVTLWARSEGENIVCGITDTGIGISAEDQQRLFTKFFRSRDAAARGVAGTGLGLCIARRIVEAHGGRIEIESCPGAGTTARVTLPAFREEPA